MVKLSFVIPVYHGEKTIEPLFERIQSYCTEYNHTYEVIFVWDCGPDNSWNIIKSLKKLNPNIITGVKLSRNFGQHNAIICGCSLAKGTFIVTMDEDLQQDPYDVEKLLTEQLVDDFDVVYGKFPDPKHSLFRNITSTTLKKTLQYSIPELHKDYSPLRLIRSEIALELPTLKNSYTFLDGYLTWLTKSVSSIPVTHHQRLNGQSSYTISKLIEHSINIFITFSNFPIRLLTKTAFLTFVVTLIYSCDIIYNKIVGDITIPGYASLMILIGVSTALIMGGLGIVGEYLFRVNQKTTKRPTFHPKEILPL